METRRRSGRRSGSLVGALLAVVVIAAIVVVAIFVFRDDNGSNPARADVAVRACNPDAAGGEPRASGEIVNHSSKTSNYAITIEFNDPQGNQVSEGATAVNDVEAGERATWELTGVRDAKGPVVCEVGSVTRTHLPGQ
jgi:hypothetical protein